jgi:hypothetical protein
MKEEQRMSPEVREEADKRHQAHFDRLYYGADNDDEYHKKIDDKLTEEADRNQRYLDEVRKHILPVLDGYIGDENSWGHTGEEP